VQNALLILGNTVIFTTGVPRNFFSLETVSPCKKVWEPLAYILMIRVNVSLQTSICIFVNGEVLQMYTFHESNYTAIELPLNWNSTAKNK